MLKPIIIAQFGPPSLAAIRSWGRYGASVGMIQISAEGEPEARSRYLTDHIAMTADEFLRPEGLKTAIQFIKDFETTALLTINEKFACYLDENRYLLPNGIMLMFSKADVTRKVLCKSTQTKVAKMIGFNILPTWEIKNDSDVVTLLSTASFPLCLRPAGNGAVKPGFKANCFFSIIEIQHFLKKRTLFNGTIIAQPFLDCPNLVVHGIRGPDGNHFGITGFIVNRKFEGVTLTIRFIEISNILQCQCKAFADTFNIIGPYHFEFLYDQANGIPWFLELNSRLGGTTAKVMACGYDEPAWTLKAFGYNIAPGLPVKNITASSKKAIIKYLVKTLKGKQNPLDYPNETRWKKTLSALYGLAFWRDDVFHLHDLPGTLTLYKLNPQFRNRIVSEKNN